jgi:hypothetical protein
MAAHRLLLHALTKIYITGELQLLDREAVANYLDRVTGVALRLCRMPIAISCAAS